MILQFRSVRILIAQDQLDQVLRQVRTSDQPVVVADAQGRVINTNAAFDYLLDTGARPLQDLDELPPYFADPDEFAAKLRVLRDNKRPWRGETQLGTASGEAKPLLVRADPVMSSPDRTLGFVMLFTDLTERKAADAARRKFHESILQARRTLKRRIDSKADLALENLMSNRGRKRATGGDGDCRRPRHGTHARNAGKRANISRADDGSSRTALDRAGKIAKLKPFVSSAGVEHREIKMTTASDLRAVDCAKRQRLRMNACTVIEGSPPPPPAQSPCRTIGFCSRGSLDFIEPLKPSWKPRRAKSRSALTSRSAHDRPQSKAICACLG